MTVLLNKVVVLIHIYRFLFVDQARFTEDNKLDSSFQKFVADHIATLVQPPTNTSELMQILLLLVNINVSLIYFTNYFLCNFYTY